MSATNRSACDCKQDHAHTQQGHTTVSVLIADTDPRVRSALRLFLEHMPEVRSVAEAQDVSGLLAALKRAHPDILLLDWHLASDHIYALVLLLRALEPRLKKVVVLSLSSEDRRHALAAGADAFVRKGDTSEELLLALRLDHTTVCLNLSSHLEGNGTGSPPQTNRELTDEAEF